MAVFMAVSMNAPVSGCPSVPTLFACFLSEKLLIVNNQPQTKSSPYFFELVIKFQLFIDGQS